MNLHSIGMALGLIAAMLAAFLTAAPSAVPEPYDQAVAGIVAACSVGSVYLQRFYAPSPPQQAPP